MLALCLMAAFCAAPEYVDVYVANDPVADVFLTAEEVSQLQQRMAQDPTFQQRAKALITKAEAHLAQPIEIPRKAGAWLMVYTCPDHGEYLRFEEGEHRCPVDGKAFSSPNIEAGHRAFIHENNSRQCEDLGWAYTLTGKEAYAGRVHEILTAYAGFYRELPLQKADEEGGRLQWQTLNEAMLLLRFTVGYDRTRKAPCYSGGDRRQIEAHLLRPMAEIIRPRTRPQSNWQAWHNSAIGCAGYVLNDGDLADWAINGEAGFLFQRENCIKGSGIWHEESPTYHLFALEPYTYLFEAAIRADSNLYAERVKLFFDAPLRYLLPDLTFPPLNNSDRRNIQIYGHLYEAAYRRFHDKAYLPLLQSRNTALGLVWGEVDLPGGESGSLTLQSMTLPEDGLAVLRDPTGSMAAFLDYSGKGSIHTHPAKLGLLLFAHGDIRFVDPGRISYNHRMQGDWYAQTIAHNAPVVNTASQAPAAGQCTAFAATGTFRIVRATCEDAYPNVLMDRTLAQHHNLWIDVVQLFGGVPMTADLPLHLLGTLTGLPEATPSESLGGAKGYEFIEQVASLGKAAFTCTLRTGNLAGIHITVADPAGGAFVAEAPGYVPTERLPMLLRRQEGRHATFVSVYEVFSGEDHTPTPIEVRHEHPLRVQVGDIAIELGSVTIVQVDGESHYIGPDGVTGTRPLPAPSPAG
jgi:hypothetical protein